MLSKRMVAIALQYRPPPHHGVVHGGLIQCCVSLELIKTGGGAGPREHGETTLLLPKAEPTQQESEGKGFRELVTDLYGKVLASDNPEFKSRHCFALQCVTWSERLNSASASLLLSKVCLSCLTHMVAKTHRMPSKPPPPKKKNYRTVHKNPVHWKLPLRHSLHTSLLPAPGVGQSHRRCSANKYW